MYCGLSRRMQGYLEEGHHLARLHRRRRRRRAYVLTSNTASHDNHEKINSWVFFSLASGEEKGYFRVVSVGHLIFDCRMYCGLSRRMQGAFLMIFRRFPTSIRRFPKIFQNCSKDQTNIPEHLPKIPLDIRRFPKIAEDFPGRPEDVSMIHQRI